MFCRSLFFVIVLFLHLSTNAQHSVLAIEDGDVLKLTKVYTPNRQIKIDGKWRKADYCFTIDKRIEFKKGQYIQVLNLNTGIPDITISGDELIRTNTSTIRDYILVKMAGGKGGGGFARFLEKCPWSMVEDTLYIPTKYLLDNRHAFFLKSIPDNIALPPIPYDKTTNELVITKEFLLKNGVNCSDYSNLRFRVEYWEGHTKSEAITDNFVIEYIPKF